LEPRLPPADLRVQTVPVPGRSAGDGPTNPKAQKTRVPVSSFPDRDPGRRAARRDPVQDHALPPADPREPGGGLPFRERGAREPVMNEISPDGVLHLVARLAAVGGCLGGLELLSQGFRPRPASAGGRGSSPREQAARWGTGAWHVALPALVTLRLV